MYKVSYCSQRCSTKWSIKLFFRVVNSGPWVCCSWPAEKGNFNQPLVFWFCRTTSRSGATDPWIPVVCSSNLHCVDSYLDSNEKSTQIKVRVKELVAHAHVQGTTDEIYIYVRVWTEYKATSSACLLASWNTRHWENSFFKNMKAKCWYEQMNNWNTFVSITDTDTTTKREHRSVAFKTCFCSKDHPAFTKRFHVKWINANLFIVELKIGKACTWNFAGHQMIKFVDMFETRSRTIFWHYFDTFFVHSGAKIQQSFRNHRLSKMDICSWFELAGVEEEIVQEQDTAKTQDPFMSTDDDLGTGILNVLPSPATSAVAQLLLKTLFHPRLVHLLLLLELHHLLFVLLLQVIDVSCRRTVSGKLCSGKGEDHTPWILERICAAQ